VTVHSEFGNILRTEHVNLRQPDQRLATIFYVSGLGLTRDPYMMTGVENMWINAGRNQMHLPTGNPQRLRGRIGLVLPDLDSLRERLADVAPLLSQTEFRFEDSGDFVEVICPWGNRFQCHPPSQQFGDVDLGIAYVEFDVASGTASRISAFYQEIMGAEAASDVRDGSATTSIHTGKNQYLRFRETHRPLTPYDGHHIQIYIADFVQPHDRLRNRNLITRVTDRNEWRFRDIVDPSTNEVLFTLEHEVRSLEHPLYDRPLINRNPTQTNRDYIPGKDAFSGKL
jgi:hypothetical protein